MTYTCKEFKNFNVIILMLYRISGFIDYCKMFIAHSIIKTNIIQQKDLLLFFKINYKKKKSCGY